ncbi:MAG: hypothetical protein E6Q97_27310 [Desulfurellales bacterium]|nr:MAG: hypothetical protein E6Q97_27310 [Desulfurellales bacterium]
MKKLSNQLSFESLLEDDVPLKPHIVMWGDPRWDSALIEMSTAPHVGIDIEFWADADGDPAMGDADSDGLDADDDSDPLTPDEEDPANTIIRLVQVALPSGLCIVADFGGIADDRTARRRRYGDEGAVDVHVIDQVTVAVPRYTPGSFLAVLRDLCESTTRQKRLQNAKGDALRLRHAFGIRMRCIRCTMLASQLYWAGVRGLRHGLGFLSERAVAASAPGVWAVSKRLQQSEWRWHLSNAQINYAADDALLMSPLWEWLASRLRAAGMTATAMAEMNAIAPFVEFEFHGMPVNPAMLEDHLTLWRRGREEAIKPFLARYPGVDPSRTQVVAVAMTQDSCYGGHKFYELDYTKPRRNPVWIHGERFDFAFLSSKGRYSEPSDHSVSEAVLSRWSSLPWVSALLDWRSLGVVIKWMENVQRRVRSDGRVRGEYAQIAGGESRAGDDSGLGAGMGRSAARSPSLQQSANPQPKLSAIIHAAARFSGKPVSYSPRLPFVAHDANAAAYLRWASARLRGEAVEPLAQRGGVVAGWLGDDSDGSEASPAAVSSPPASAPAKAAWYDRLAVEWETNPRGFGVADFSQAHMRIAAQASQDPQLCEDFRLDRDAHLKLAYDFGKATGRIELDVPIETFFGWYSKGHPKQPFVKELRQPAKTGNYTKLNLGSVARLKGAGDTAKPPVVLETSAWQLISDAWLSRYSTLAQFQRHVVDKANAYDVVIDGEHYGIGWSLRTGRRLYLRKHSDRFSRGEPRYCPDCGKTHGRLTVKATDAVAFTWLSTEADAIKWALGRILDEFDAHDAYWMARGLRPVGEIWDAHMCSMAHDELDFTARKAKMVAAAGCVRKWFNEGLRWSGVVDIPVEGGAAKDSDLVVACWADK